MIYQERISMGFFQSNQYLNILPILGILVDFFTSSGYCEFSLLFCKIKAKVTSFNATF